MRSSAKRETNYYFHSWKVPNADDLQGGASFDCSGDFKVDVDNSVTISDSNKQFDLKSLRFSWITNPTKEGDDPRGNKENKWCISSPHHPGRWSFYNVKFVAVVNKETVVKLRNSFELCMNTERPLKTRKHGGALCVSSVIGHLTGSRNEILSRCRFHVCWQSIVSFQNDVTTARYFKQI